MARTIHLSLQSIWEISLDPLSYIFTARIQHYIRKAKPAGRPKPIRILSASIWFLSRHGILTQVRLRLPIVERLVVEEGPDVLCLQEIKCQEHQFPTQPLSDLGYQYQSVHGQKGYHGVATVSRIPLKELSRHDWQANQEARHVGVELLGAGSGIIIENVYVPAGGDEPNRDKNPKFGQKLVSLSG